MTDTATFYFAPGFVLGAAIVLGLAGGYAFHRIWRRILPRSYSRSLLQRLPADVRGMLTSQEPSEMLKHYKAVLLGMLGWSARNSVALALGLLPVGAAFLLLAEWDPSDRLAAEIEAHPADADRRVADGGAPWRFQAGRMLAERDDIAAAGVSIVADQRVRADQVAKKHAFCASIAACALFEMMLFDTHAVVELDRSIVVRPAFFDANPFWPYVNDLELLFFAAVMLGSAGAAWGHRQRRPKAQ